MIHTSKELSVVPILVARIDKSAIIVILYAFSVLFEGTTLWDSYFTNQNIVTKRSLVTFQKSYSWDLIKLGFALG